ncbi:MAG: alpha/beta hydrolase, partial [Rhodoglobus sp.]
RVSPLFGDFTGLGPITVISGTRDIVYADALRMIPAARAAGVQVNTIVGEGMIHVYPLLPLRESAPARDAMARAIS